MISEINSVLMRTAPFILMVALAFGFVAAWLGLGDLVPVVKQIWRPSGSAQGYGILAGCLSLVVLAAGGRGVK
jgi:hypothetical protein